MGRQEQIGRLRLTGQKRKAKSRMYGDEQDKRNENNESKCRKREREEGALHLRPNGKRGAETVRHALRAEAEHCGAAADDEAHAVSPGRGAVEEVA